MKFTLSLSLALSLVSAPSFAANGAEIQLDRDAIPMAAKNSNVASNLIKGAPEFVVCLDSDTLNVRNDRLNKVLFSVKKYEKVKTFQGWGNNKKTAKIGAKKYSFVKVQFPALEADGKANTGWVAEAYVKATSQCPGAVKEEKKIAEETKKEVEQKTDRSKLDIRGIDDPNCCEFPTMAPPTAAITSPGMWNFGWRRSGGARLHAACDLYRSLNEPIVAVAPGVVARGIYYFYQNTYALEVRHAGGFVVRYGETTSKMAKGVSAGRTVAPGQVLGYIGKTSHPRPMLHFELYSGKGSGSLNAGGNKYQRRWDLVNPTKYLVKWQDNKFRDRK